MTRRWRVLVLWQRVRVLFVAPGLVDVLNSQWSWDNPLSRGTFSLQILQKFLKRHYVLIEFLFFRPIFCFSVLDVTRLVLSIYSFGEGKRKNPSSSDGTLVG